MVYLALYLVVGFLALLAAACMRWFAPATALLAGGARELLLRTLGRGLDLEAGGRTAHAHAVMGGQFRGRPLRLQLGAGFLHLEVGSVLELGSMHVEVSDHYLRTLLRSRLPLHGLELTPAGVALLVPLRLVLRRGLPQILEELLSLLARVEGEIGDPANLVRTAQTARLSGRLRAHVLEYGLARHRGAPEISRLLAASIQDRAPEVRIAGARALGSAGSSALLELVEQTKALSGRSQRLLLDALLELKPEPLESILEAIALQARPKTLLYLLDAVKERPESLTVARAVLTRRNSRHANGITSRQLALKLLTEDHEVELWEADALAILSNDAEPVTLRQSAFEALVAAGARRPAFDAARAIASSHVPLRGWAIGSLAKHRGAKEAEWLISLARRDESARLPVLLAFSDLQGRGEEWLLECLGSQSHLVLEQCLTHLESFGSLHSVGPVRALGARLAKDPEARALLHRARRCVDSIIARHRGAEGLAGALAMANPDDDRGRLMLSPPAGSVSAPERTP